MQVCSGASLDSFNPFRLCIFDGLEDGYDIYFLHPYPQQTAILCLLALVPAEGQKSVVFPSGIYITATTNGINFLTPILVHKCEDFERRTYDLPINGSLRLDDPEKDYVTILVHANVPCRIPQNSPLVEEIHYVHCKLPHTFCKIWQESKRRNQSANDAEWTRNARQRST